MPDTDMSIAWREVFERTPGNFLVLDTEWNIRAVSDAYLSATMTKREQIVGRHLFDVFPDDPSDPEATGEANLSFSLNEVKRTLKPHKMPVQRYPIRRPDGTWEERYWQPLNSPVLDVDGNLSYIVHTVDDVTDKVMSKDLRHTYLRQHPILFCTSLASFIVSLLFLLGLMDTVSAIGIAFHQDPWLVAIWEGGLALGSACVLYGVLRLIPEVEGFGLIILSGCFTTASLAALSLSGRGFAASIFIGLAMGHFLRTLAIFWTIRDARNHLAS